jgi:hypothetical protein
MFAKRPEEVPSAPRTVHEACGQLAFYSKKGNVQHILAAGMQSRTDNAKTAGRDAQFDSIRKDFRRR